MSSLHKDELTHRPGKFEKLFLFRWGSIFRESTVYVDNHLFLSNSDSWAVVQLTMINSNIVSNWYKNCHITFNCRTPSIIRTVVHFNVEFI